jgi:phosphoglycolate phosphatase
MPGVASSNAMKNLEQHLQDKTHIIWDWNGTLLDDVDLCVMTMSAILSKYMLPTLTREKYREQFCFPVIEYYKKLGFDFDKVPFAVVADEFIELYKKNLHESRLHTGVSQLLESLKQQGKKHSILSAARELDLIDQLKWLEVHHHFDHIYGISDHYAAGKVARGKELIAKLRQLIPDSKESVIMVGDTDHDIEVARELGIDLLLVSDGHQTHERLQALHPLVITR